jgi:hypothetical protein
MLLKHAIRLVLRAPIRLVELTRPLPLPRLGGER